MRFDRRKLILWCTIAFIAGVGAGYGFVQGRLHGAAERAPAQPVEAAP